MAGSGIVLTSFVPVPVAASGVAPVAVEGAVPGFRDLLDARVIALAGEATLAQDPASPAPDATVSDPTGPKDDASAAAETPVAAIVPLPLAVTLLAAIARQAPAQESVPFASTPGDGPSASLRDALTPTDPTASLLPGAGIPPFASSLAASLAIAASSPSSEDALRVAAAPALPLPLGLDHGREGERHDLDMAPSPAPAVVAPPVTHAAAPPFAIEPPVGAPGWAEAVADRVVLVARDAGGSAELHVQPPELGPVTVRIDVRGDQATVVFGATQAETRSALEAALPRLVESLAAQGLALAHAHVGAQLARHGGGEASGDTSGSGDGGAGDVSPLLRTGETARSRVGLVDVFA